MTLDSAARPRTNWAGNIAFAAPDFYRPAAVSELQAVVARARQVRVLATGHSFNDMADSPGAQVSLAGLPPEVEVDSANSLVRVAAGLSYAGLAARLDAKGFALRNMASLPHISVAGACATATHGSGVANQNLAAAITAQQIVTADGDIVEFRRGDDTFPGDDAFPGAVVHLGALGVVTHLVLAVVPSFDVSQRVYENLPLEVLDDHFADIMASGYSVSLFTDWRAPRLTQVWIKQLTDGDPDQPACSRRRSRKSRGSPRRPPRPRGTRCPACPRRPAPSSSGCPARGSSGCLTSGPSSPRAPATNCSRSTCCRWPTRCRPCTRCTRSATGWPRWCGSPRSGSSPPTSSWLSPCYRRNSVAFHFTWIPDMAAVLPVVTLMEQQLAPFGARPHWGKVFTTPARELHASYDRMPDFLDLAAHYDPAGKFRNAYTARYLGR